MCIAKPFVESKEKETFISSNYADFDKLEDYIVQRYVSKHFMIDGQKFNMRVYALLMSIKPFKMYIYQEGLVKFYMTQTDLDLDDSQLVNFYNQQKSKS